MLENEERNYYLGFSVFSGIGPIKFKMLLERFGSAKDAWEAAKTDLEKVVGEKLTEKFDKFRNTFSVSSYAKRLVAQGVSFLILMDHDYPKLLSKIKNPPFVLYVRGDKEILLRQLTDQNDPSTLRQAQGSGQAKYIAVVGARKTTQYGREVTKILTQELVSAGFIIVSGLAIGIDAISHKTAIENGGATIAVLGCGVDCCYPLTNQSIYNSIVSGNGCVVSEYPLGQRPSRGSFPARNRIIAGLSLGVLVTEGGEDSGSLITADYALSFGRRVFAVPGPITSSLSKGPYKLIAKGAKLVTSGQDILRELKITNLKSQTLNKSQNTKFKTESKEEQKILDLLRNEPLHFDEIVRRSGLDSQRIGSVLSFMEIRGMVKGLDGGAYSI